MTPTDDDALDTFRTFLWETPHDLPARRAAEWVQMFPHRPAYDQWRSRWLPYFVGLADGPTTPEEYAEHRPRVFGRRRPCIEGIDRFHA